MAKALYSRHFKLVFLTLVVLLVVLVVLGLIAEFLNLDAGRTWTLATLVAGWIAGLLSSLGIPTT